jgi:hypothetical protein
MRKFVLGMAACAAILAYSATAVASPPTISYTGQGWISNGNGGFILNDERCGVGTQTPANDGSTGQFANWNGPGLPYQTGQGYTVWVLSLNANPAGGVTLHLPDSLGGEVKMIKVGGTWKYASQYVSREAALHGPIGGLDGPVHVTFSGPTKNAQLTVSHGCKPFNQDKPAWCSPGFWNGGNITAAAWALTGYAKTDTFNTKVVPSFYDTPYADGTFRIGNGPNASFLTDDPNTPQNEGDPTLQQVLDNPGGVNSTVSGPYDPELNQFNATAAMLTDGLPGYAFTNGPRDPVTGELIDNCPIDPFGNWKV